MLDLGCGDGALLRYLIETRGVQGYGVEIDDANVLALHPQRRQRDPERPRERARPVSRRVPSTTSILSQHAADGAPHRATSCAKCCASAAKRVVSFPNFAYWKNRRSVLDGRMPVSEDLPYQWYDTPNVRFFTMLDFEALCEQMGIAIRERSVLDEHGKPVEAATSANSTSSAAWPSIA